MPDVPPAMGRGAMPDGLAAAMALLRCPRCHGALAAAPGRSVRCPAGHAFDVARQGYLSLTAGPAAPGGDTAAMVAAREAVLGAGHFAALADAVAAAGAPGPDGAIVEVGAGTGHYLARALERSPGRLGVALDVSRYALRRAARAHPRAAAIGCDVWGPLPLRDGVAGRALCVFAPRNGPELRRVLAGDGVLVVATPAPDHLGELVEALGLLRVDPRKDERLAERLAGGFELVGRERVAWTMRLDRDACAVIAGMGPSAFHAEPAALPARVAALPEPLAVTGSATVAVYGRA